MRLAACLCLVLGVSIPACAGDKTPPSIVIILADDMGYGDPGCYNKDSKTPTPHIDRLAKRGMRFTDAHSAAAVCTPSRYALLTGRYPWRSSLKKGVLQGYSRSLLEPGRLTLAELLRRNGYFTACIGKWHLGLGDAEKTDYAKPLKPGPRSAGFDYFLGIAASLDMPPYVYIENEGVTAPPSGTIADQDKPRGGAPFWRGGAIAPDFKHEEVLDKLTDKAVDIISKQSAKKPFFLYFPLPAPHMPVLPTKPYVGKTKAGPYGDFVVQVDEVVGRVMKALEEAKLANNTLVIFTSDNGGYWFPVDIETWGHRSNGPLRGQKADIYEAGHRVPFIAAWPGVIPEGKSEDEVVCHTDLFMTAARMVGAKVPDDAAEDSFDLRPVFKGDKRVAPIRPFTIHQAADGELAIRQGPWRLCRTLGSHGFSTPRTLKAKAGEAEGELFDLSRDLSETRNLWLEQPEVVRRLAGLLQKSVKEGRTR